MLRQRRPAAAGTGTSPVHDLCRGRGRPGPLPTRPSRRAGPPAAGPREDGRSSGRPAAAGRPAPRPNSRRNCPSLDGDGSRGPLHAAAIGRPAAAVRRKATDARAHDGRPWYAAIARPTRLPAAPDDDSRSPLTITNDPPRLRQYVRSLSSWIELCPWEKTPGKLRDRLGVPVPDGGDDGRDWPQRCMPGSACEAGIVWPGGAGAATVVQIGCPAAPGSPSLRVRACLAQLSCAPRRWRWPGAGRRLARRGRGG
jgi:hypothetical protein